MKTTQKELILRFVKMRGEIIPSHMSDNDWRMKDGFIGSEVKRRCCELRNSGELVSSLKKGFVVFTLPIKTLTQSSLL